MYNLQTIDSDIALLKISPYITYENHTQPVCLPDRDAQVGELAHFSGYEHIFNTRLHRRSVKKFDGTDLYKRPIYYCRKLIEKF